MAWNRAVRIVASVLAIGIPLASGCSKKTAESSVLCTPGAYVFCRCLGGDEGQKLCATDGNSFGACAPCLGDYDAGNQQPPSIFDSGMVVEDVFVPPPPPLVDAAPIDAAAIDAPVITGDTCAKKLAIIGGNGSNAYTAIYTGNGNYAVATSGSGAMHATPAIIPRPGGFEAVFLANSNELLSTTYSGNAWSLATRIGSVSAVAAPAIAPLGDAIELVYLNTNDDYFHGEKTASGWNSATDQVVPADDSGGPSYGPSAAAGVSVGGVFEIAYAGANLGLYRQSWTSETGWSDVDQQSGSGFGQTAEGFVPPPSMIAMVGGTSDLLLVYAETSDFQLRFTTRDAQSGTWSITYVIDPNAYATEAFSLAPMSNGRAMLVYRGTDDKPYFSAYDPSQSTPWSAPAELVSGNNPTVAVTPAVAIGNCGEDAVAVYAETGGAVNVTRFTTSVWSTPAAVTSLNNLTYVNLAESP